MNTVEAFIAATRYGLGAGPGDFSAIAPDPRGWLLEQLGPVDGSASRLASLPAGKDMLAAFLGVRKDRDARKRFLKETALPLYRREAAGRTLAAIGTDTPFRERLIRFWSNHFTVSVKAARLQPLVGAFEREAIRPYVAGRFADMLLAVARHPAMLIYLDNVTSIGPKSRTGLRSHRGLNENLAREILELHTLGVDGGYDQTDVVALAKILTGWTFATLGHDDPGAFYFRANWHEPGEKRLLGRVFENEDDGIREGEKALRMLASHPSTARFIATKLARHFVSDDPPPSTVERLRRAYLDSDGDLGAVSRALVTMPEAWQDPLAKVKAPDDLVVSAFRLLGPPVKENTVLTPLRLLGQLPFRAPSPAGWPDLAASWIGPESLLRRIELLELLSKRYTGTADPRQLSEAALGQIAGADTVAAIRNAPSTGEALAVLLTSREFQRR